MLFTKKESVIFLAGEVVAHNGGTQVDKLMYFLLRHAGHQDAGQSVIAEMLEKGDQGLFIRGAVHSKKHGIFFA
jgi:hypothetical protein